MVDLIKNPIRISTDYKRLERKRSVTFIPADLPDFIIHCIGDK